MRFFHLIQQQLLSFQRLVAMRFLTILYITCCLPLMLGAQPRYYRMNELAEPSGMFLYNGYQQLGMDRNADSLFAARGIKQALVTGNTVQISDPTKRRSSDSMLYLFGPDGLIQEHVYYTAGKNGIMKLKFRRSYSWTEGKMLQSMRWKFGKDAEQMTQYYRNAAGKTERVETSVAGKDGLRFQTLYRYHDSGMLCGKVSYKKGKEMSRWEYDYHPDRSMSESRYYRKGKLAQVQRFECNPRGSAVSKKTALVCHKKEVLPDGRRLEVWNSDQPGNTTKYVYCYDAQNRILFMENWNEKPEPYYVSTFRYEGDTIFERQVNRWGVYRGRDSIVTLYTRLLSGKNTVATQTIQYKKGKAEQTAASLCTFEMGLPLRREDEFSGKRELQIRHYRFY